MASPHAPSAGSPKGGELLSLQYLRGPAAVLVVIHHALSQLETLPASAAFLQGGVDIFFVISGFVMWFTTWDRPISAGLFVRKRLARIVPLYWILTSFVVVVLLFAHRLMQSTRFDLAHVIASYLFVAWPNPQPGIGLRPLMIPGWTLNYEMFFYGLFALGLLAPARIRAGVILGGLVALTAIGALVPGLPDIARFYTSPLILEFVMGLIIAMTLPLWRPRSPILPAVLVLAAAVTLAGSHWGGVDDGERLLLMGVPGAVLVLGAVLAEKARPFPYIGWAKLIGDASYAIYLSHTLLLSALAQVWRRLPAAAQSPALFAAAAIPASILVGIALHLWLERPVIAWVQRRLKTGRAPLAAPSPLAEASR